MKYISLGSSCSIAYNLRKLNLSNKYLPFDWIRISNFNNVSELIKNNFDDFLNVNTFEFKNINNNFMVNNKMKSYVYKNRYCTFFHEFDDYIENINTNNFIEKYKRRIIRFYDLINNNDITFIREEFGKLNQNKIIKFMEIFNYKHKLLIITNDSNYKNIFIDNVYFYFSNNKIEVWTRPELDWVNIFKP